jgi:hypothetical protein
MLPSLQIRQNTVFNFGEKVLQSPLNLKHRPLFLIFLFFLNMTLIKTLVGAIYYILQNIPRGTLMASEPARKQTVQDASLCTPILFVFQAKHCLERWVFISVLPDSQQNWGIG